MIVFRLSRKKFRYDLSGRGAEITGGRWNSKGVRMLYTSQSRALCTAEIAVHSPLGIVPTDYWLSSIEIPANAPLDAIDPAKLPAGWRSFPHPHATQLIGDQFIHQNKFLVLKVPSAVVPGDFNFLINPAHKLFSKVKVKKAEKFAFDERLFVRN
jgi:RES domain-containing protein